MSKISKEGYEQITVIKNALDSIYDKLNRQTLYTKDEGTKVKNIEKLYTEVNVFESIQEEVEAIAGIVANAEYWEEV